MNQPKTVVKIEEVARVDVLWFHGEEGDGPDDAVATVHAMGLPTGPQVAVDLDVVEDGTAAVGRFSFYVHGARLLAKALIDAADKAESFKREE